MSFIRLNFSFSSLTERIVDVSSKLVSYWMKSFKLYLIFYMEYANDSVMNKIKKKCREVKLLLIDKFKCFEKEFIFCYKIKIK
jgi:hypothetical protein